MKQRVTLLLLLGYLLLVPYCFLGAPMSASHTPIEMSDSMPMEDMGDCGMMNSGCSGSTHGAHALEHHASMYMTITGASGFFGYVLSLVFFVVVLGLFLGEQRTLYCRLRSRFRARDVCILRALTQHDFLRWLSLTETSPTFA